MKGGIVAIALVLLSLVAGSLVARASVIIVGAGFSGISAAKTLSDAGITDIVILEATGRIGGRIHNTDFAGLKVEMGANWVEGVHGKQMNPILEMVNDLHLINYRSDYSNLSSNTYKQDGGLHDKKTVEETIDLSDKINESGEKLSSSFIPSGRDDISVLTLQRLNNHVPSTPIEMVVDYYTYDYEFAEPPRLTSLQNTVPLATFANFGDDVYFVADRRGYESVVHHVASMFLKTDKNASIVDPRLKLNKVVRNIRQSRSGVIVTTEDGSVYNADYVMVSVSIGVLQTKLIHFEPDLPRWKIMAIYQFDMAVYTKIFLKFPYKFWPDGNGTEFFLYASERRGYYPVWQVNHLSKTSRKPSYLKQESKVI